MIWIAYFKHKPENRRRNQPVRGPGGREIMDCREDPKPVPLVGRGRGGGCRGEGETLARNEGVPLPPAKPI